VMVVDLEWTMALRSSIQRLERKLGEGRSSFITKDGRVIRYDADEVGTAIFVYVVNMITHLEGEPRPEEPPIIKTIREEARYPEQVMARFGSRDSSKFLDPVLLLNPPVDDEGNGPQTDEDGG
jgi:hypothetical protein